MNNYRNNFGLRKAVSPTILLLVLLFLVSCNDVKIRNMTVEYNREPIWVDVMHPRFGWQMHSSRKGAAQMDYRISVSDENGRLVWDSGIVKDGNSLGILYEGDELQPRTRYNWGLTITDERGKTHSSTSWFETSLMSSSDSDEAWHGAKWIGGDETALPFEAQYLSVFRLKFSLSSDGPATFMYGANDERLEEGSYIGLEFKERQLIVSRRNYPDEDAEFRYELPASSGLRNVELTSVSGLTNIWVNGSPVVRDLNLNPVGRGGDYTAYPELCDLGFSSPEGVNAHFSKLEVQNYRLPRHTLARVEDVSVCGQTRMVELPRTGLTQLRRSFRSDKEIRKARIYATARGVYDLYLNGDRVSEDYLAPGLTQYEKTHFYQVYDVTGLIKAGDNELGAVLAEGWWSGAVSFSPDNWNYWGDRQALLAQLVLTYEDGTEEFIVSDKDWEWSNNGPYRYGSIFQGEIYDARLEGSGDWKNAREVPLEDIISHERPGGGFVTWPATDDYSSYRLVAQEGLPVREFKRISAISVKEVRPGTYIYDMGQNMPGVVHLTFRNLNPGTRVKIRYAEVLYPELPEYGDKAGEMMLENLRSAMVQDIYIAAGGVERYQPRFTYHGYQYVEIEGVDHPLPLKDVEGVVLSTIDRISFDYKSDNALLNRFVENVKWSSLANIFSVPTDCPQRNERMGWSGDLSVFCPAMSYIFDGTTFLRRHLTAIRDNTSEAGIYPAIAPIGGGFGGPLWESVGIIMPWQNYLQYGDVDALRSHYPSMVKYLDRVLENYIDPVDGHYCGQTGWGGLGDWLGFEVQKNENSLIFDCYLVYELELMGKMSAALGEDSSRWERAREVRRAYIADHYFNDDGSSRRLDGSLVDTQTSYVLPLAFDVLDDALKSKVLQQLVRVAERPGASDDGIYYPEYSLMTGFIGTPWITYALSENGRADLAYKMLLNNTFPSWLYPVTQGATTIWERLNSLTAEDGFGGNNSMNSFNHYAFGSVLDWMMERSLGIDQDESSPGFRHFYLRPVPDPSGGLKEASGWYDSPYGRICSSWKRSGNKLRYKFTVPANTTATLILPGEDPRELVAGEYEFGTKF